MQGCITASTHTENVKHGTSLKLSLKSDTVKLYHNLISKYETDNQSI